ncbi:glycosyltransferase, partial [Patescibacteria group bacterium]|nr:glycosyltransferase [Patescibacteria group bacterium]
TIPHLKRAISPINDLKALFEIIKLIKKIKPNIIHLNSSKISILGSIAFAFIRIFAISGIRIYSHISVIYTVHGWVFNESLPSWKKLFYKYVEKFTAILKNKIICVSQLDYNIARNQLKIPEKKLSLIYHGIKPINFLLREKAWQKMFSQSTHTSPPTPSPKQEMGSIENSSLPSYLGGAGGGIGGGAGGGINNGEVIIGTIANLYKTKGLEYLIQAIYIIKREFLLLTSNFLLIIIGEGEERKNLESLIAQMNLKNTVILAGRIDNAAELLRGFDIFCCSSVKEGFPYAILEAMSAGLPIVSTKVGGISDMISDNQNGLLAEAKNPQDLAKKIIEIINNPEFGQKLGAQAKMYVEEKFSFDKMVGKTKEVYFNRQNPLPGDSAAAKY